VTTPNLVHLDVDTSTGLPLTTATALTTGAYRLIRAAALAANTPATRHKGRMPIRVVAFPGEAVRVVQLRDSRLTVALHPGPDGFGRHVAVTLASAVDALAHYDGEPADAALARAGVSANLCEVLADLAVAPDVVALRLIVEIVDAGMVDRRRGIGLSPDGAGPLRSLAAALDALPPLTDTVLCGLVTAIDLGQDASLATVRCVGGKADGSVVRLAVPEADRESVARAYLTGLPVEVVTETRVAAKKVRRLINGRIVVPAATR
jgi:hypothetical protein